MSKSWLRYLAFLGLLGLLGFFTSNPGLYGFFGFFGFLSYNRKGNDEMLESNINRACRNVFIAAVLIFVVGFSVVLLVQPLVIDALWVLALTFAAQMLVFGASLSYYEYRGSAA